MSSLKLLISRVISTFGFLVGSRRHGVKGPMKGKRKLAQKLTSRPVRQKFRRYSVSECQKNTSKLLCSKVSIFRGKLRQDPSPIFLLSRHCCQLRVRGLVEIVLRMCRVVKLTTSYVNWSVLLLWTLIKIFTDKLHNIFALAVV